MLKKDFYQILPVIILAFAIALSPSFSAGEIEGGRIIEIRVEDILIVILGLLWIASFLISGRKKIEKPPLFFPILAWLSIGLISVLTNWIFANITLSGGFFFFLKEIQFFLLYFYLFYHLKTIDSIKFIVKAWIFLGLVNVGWIIYEMIRGLKLTYYYGPTLFIEPEGTLPGGGFLLVIFIFLFNILLFYYLSQKISNFKKGILIVTIISLIIGIYASGSRASFFGLIFALFLTFLFYSIRKGFLKTFLIGVFVSIFLISIFVFLEKPLIKRYFSLEDFLWNLNPENPVSRPGIWVSRLSEASKYPLFFLFGLGKSVFGESHSQYVRNFIETGIVGSLIFLFLMFIILKKAWQGFSRVKNPLLIGLSSGLFVATLTLLFISISAEAFIVVKISEVYWFFVALTMVALNPNQTKSFYA